MKQHGSLRKPRNINPLDLAELLQKLEAHKLTYKKVSILSLTSFKDVINYCYTLVILTEEK